MNVAEHGGAGEAAGAEGTGLVRDDQLYDEGAHGAARGRGVRAQLEIESQKYTAVHCTLISIDETRRFQHKVRHWFQLAPPHLGGAVLGGVRHFAVVHPRAGPRAHSPTVC